MLFRCFEERPGGRLRFAHTGQWTIEIPGKPLLPSPEEKEYLIRRVQDEISRSKSIVSNEAMTEYNAALEHYKNLATSNPPTLEARAPKSDRDLRRWLENMVTHHRYTPHEIRAATGLPLAKVRQKLADWNITGTRLAKRSTDAPLKVLPYPGGRHPRIGFLDGALVPQRDTKVSIFAPWDPHSYAVVDVPEAIWSNLGLTYLAHTHIPTIWDKLSKTLEPLEWQLNKDGSLVFERKLPNGIIFGSRVTPEKKDRQNEPLDSQRFTGKTHRPTGASVRDAQGPVRLQPAHPRQQSHRWQLGGLPRCRRPTLDHHRLGAASSTLGKPACPLPPRRPLFPGLPSRQNRPSQRHHCVSRGQRHSSNKSQNSKPNT